MAYDIAYPYHVDARGRTATTAAQRHLHELIEQLLFTTPGERVNRPDFGCDLLQLAFEPNSDALEATTRMTIQSSLQRWLGDRIQVEGVEITSREEALRVTVAYRPRTGGPAETAVFERGI